MNDELYVVVAESCVDCNSIAVGVYDHLPTNDEINDVDKKCGGMYCIGTRVFKVNGNSAVDEENEVNVEG